MNWIMIKGLINHFNILLPKFVMITILWNYLMNIFLHFLLCQNFTKYGTSLSKPLLETVYHFVSPSPCPLTLHNSLTNSDCLFFIRYIPENTLKLCWFLFQINHDKNALLDLDSKNPGDYHVTFISRHLDDSHFCDDTARWWPLWYEYKNDKNNVPIYGLSDVVWFKT